MLYAEFLLRKHITSHFAREIRQQVVCCHFYPRATRLGEKRCMEHGVLDYQSD